MQRQHLRPRCLVKLKKTKYYLPNDVNITIETVLNLSNYGIDWEQTKIPKQYFKQVLESNSKYLEQIKLCFEDDYKFIKSLNFENFTDKKFQYYD